MTRKSRTEITIETERMLIVRQSRVLSYACCGECEGAATLVTPEEASILTGITTRAIYRLVEAGEMHFAETPNGALLVCLYSLNKESRGQPVSEPPAPKSTFSPGGRLALAEARAVAEPARQTLPPRAPTRIKSPAASHGRQSEWSLTAEAFDGLLRCLNADRERAAEKYEKIRRRLVKYFECRGCLSPDECADETINRVARCISEGKRIWASDPASYFYGVARNVLHEYWDAPERKLTPLDSLSPLAHPSIDGIESDFTTSEQKTLERLLVVLEQAIAELFPDERELIIGYYQGEKAERIDNREAMAKSLGIPVSALRIRAYRIRQKLERAVEDRLKQSPVE